MPGTDQTDNRFTMETAPIQQPDLQPQATPPSIKFLSPDRGDNGSSNLMELAKGLQNMDAGLASFMAKRQKEQDQIDAIKGEADFHKNNQKGYADAVREGIVPAWSSQAYVNAYKQAQGSVAGADLQTKFNAAYDNWDGKNSEDPNAYNNFVRQFITQNVSTDDPQVLEGLMPKVRELAARGQARYIQDRHEATVQGSVNAHVAEMDQGIAAQRLEATRTGKDFNLEAGWASITASRQKFLAAGGKATDIDNKLIDAITSQALQARGNGGPEILSLLDRNVPGTTYTFAQTPYGQSQKVNTLNTLAAWGRQAIADAATKQKEADAKELESVTGRTLESIAANPGKPVPEELIQQGTRLDGKFRANVASWQNTFASNAGTSDPQKILELNWRIINGGGTAAIQQAMENGDIRSAEELRQAVTLNKATQEAKDIVAPIMASSPAKLIIETIKQRTSSKDDLSQPFAPGGMSNAGLGLTYSFQRQLQEWALRHPGATEQEQQGAIAVIGKGILDTIQTPAGGSVTVNQPANAPPNPFLKPGINVDTGSTPQVQLPAQPSPAPQQQPATPVPAQKQGQTAPDPAAVKAWVGSLPRAQQEQILTFAQKNGLDPAVAATKFYAVQQAKMAKEAGAAGAPTPLAPGAQAQQPPQSQQPSPPPQPLPPTPSTEDLGKQLGAALKGDWKETDHVPQDVLASISTNFMAALRGTGESFGNYTLAAIKDNPKAAHILDFISGPESRGNYNAYFGHGGSTKDLSGMTLSQIMAWQKSRTDNGSPSSATGRYQFMRTTLAGLVRQMGLTGHEKFTPELQDRMAIQLLKNRGYDRWVAGKMSDATFANNLALEWASLPNMQTGRSQYAGDGLNKSLVSPRQVHTVLDAAKAKPGHAAPDTQVAEK